jgi:hypothetical protein
MRKTKWRSWAFLVFASFNLLNAQDFGTVRGIVTDPQQAVVPDAKVRLIAQVSAYAQETATDANGEFTASKVPAGEHAVEVSKEGFQTARQMLNVSIAAAPVLKFSLNLEAVSAPTEVTAALETTNPAVSSPPVTITQTDLMQTPGAERTSSLAFITNFAPGAYMLHDHLHIRGGHEVSWVMDGVPIPNTNISTNVGWAWLWPLHFMRSTRRLPLRQFPTPPSQRFLRKTSHGPASSMRAENTRETKAKR